MLTVQQIEDAVLAELKDSKPLTDACPTIETYGGQVESLVGEAAILTADMPAVYVVYSRSGFTEPANRSFDEDLTFSAIVIAKNLRGLPDLRTGAYAVLEIVRSILIDNNLELNIEPIHPISVEAIWISEKMAIYGFDFKTSQSLN